MAKWWKIGAILLAGLLLPASARAQFSLFKKAAKQDPPPAFSNGPEQKEPEFCPDPHNVQPGAPEFCPTPGGGPQTPFLPCNEEDRTAFCDYMYPEPAPLCLWVKGEYLNWWMKNQNLSQVLVTSSTAPNIATDFGALGQPSTQVLYGPQTVDIGHVPGGRVTAGISTSFLPPIEVSGFWLDKNTTLFSATSSGAAGSLLLARPVRASQLTANQETAFIAAFPGGATPVAGFVTVKSSVNLWGVDPSMFFNICSSDVAFVDVFLGYRYAELRESWQILDSATPLGGTSVFFNNTAVGAGNSTAAFDQFSTRNRFNGGQIGLRTGLSAWRLNLTADAKLAMGATTDQVSITGTSALATPVSLYRGATVVPGGILALPSNSGRTSSSEFSVIPELDINLGFQVHRSVRLFAGYSVFYWSSVVRPADQINNIVDTRQVPTSRNFVSGFTGTEPAHPFNRTDFWAQGFNFGVLIGY